MQNYGFDVIDLGKDVKCELVLEEAIKQNVKLVGLSALMTTTVPNMEKTIKLLHDNTDAKVFVGGAVLTRDYAKMLIAEIDEYFKEAKHYDDFNKGQICLKHYARPSRTR